MRDIPQALAERTRGYSWEQITLGMSEASVFRLQDDGNTYYLKIQPNRAVEHLWQERDRLLWLQGKLPVPEVLAYEQDDRSEYLLITEIRGVNASDPSHRPHLPELMALLASGLRSIHSVDTAGCPFLQTLEVKLKEAGYRTESGLIDEADFDEKRQGKKAADLFQELVRDRPESEDLVFTHGDYCLPNILICEGGVSGFIDWGRGGVADRYQDLALAARSIAYNFGSEWIPFFLKEYGLGEADEAKLEFYQLLDEFF
ncbi:aminoglycoside 3'-phosphotransferase [Paenibacillus sp. P25]|nr:aminoglycoside 3'-phosphotransferase [Paenibacillus sp. P25]